MHPALVWLTLFVWTLALELPVYAALLRNLSRDPRQVCLLVLAVNLLTHPALFQLELETTRALLGAEVMVAFVEGLALAAWLGRPALLRAWGASLAANAISTLAGLLFAAWLQRWGI